MGKTTDPAERGDLEGQQGAQPKLSPEERKRQSGYPILGESTDYLGDSAHHRAPDRDGEPKK